MLTRTRRLRSSKISRELVAETRLDIRDFIYPLFVCEGEGILNEIHMMPDVYQMSIDNIVKECGELRELGIYSIILFGIVTIKDSVGSSALDDEAIVAKATRAIKEVYSDMYVIADLCMCEYTDHGHCGVLNSDGTVHNDKTLELLAKQGLIYAKAGIDMLAPSGMMDGMISHLREALEQDYPMLPIMSYSTKFCSSYYGPFRHAANSAPQSGDRKSYQMDYRNANEAIKESLIDEVEGADILMVKPVLAYLDIVKSISSSSNLPVCVYNTSAEYSMLKLAGSNGYVNYEDILFENMYAFKRAGASMIISYHTKEVAKLLNR